MKYTRILRILSIVISLSLVMVAIPVTPAQAERTISLTPTEGNIGDTITLTGTGFTASTDDSDKYVGIYFSSDEATSGNYIDNQVKIYKLVQEGAWVTDLGELGNEGHNFTVPAVLDSGSNSTQDVAPGTTYYVYVTHSYTNPVSQVSGFTAEDGNKYVVKIVDLRKDPRADSFTFNPMKTLEGKND